MSTEGHLLAGRMIGATGAVSICECGLAFFVGYADSLGWLRPESDEQYRDVIARADDRWQHHRDSIQG